MRSRSSAASAPRTMMYRGSTRSERPSLWQRFCVALAPWRSHNQLESPTGSSFAKQHRHDSGLIEARFQAIAYTWSARIARRDRDNASSSNPILGATKESS